MEFFFYISYATNRYSLFHIRTVEHRLSAELGGRSIADNPKNKIKWGIYMKNHNLEEKEQYFIIQKQYYTVAKMNE